MQSSPTQPLYLVDPHTLEFDAEVLSPAQELAHGRFGVRLSRSYFYPGGGGQECDTGTIGETHVIEVYKDADQVIHVVDRPVAAGPVHAAVDPQRRLRNSQHHTAQHLLTGCFASLFELETVSANINGVTPSTLDLATRLALSAEDLSRAESLANQVVFENRPVRSFFATPGELEHMPLRRRPTVSENIRIVEIDDFDCTPCGGTHCTATGSIGMVKILKIERVNNDRQRVHFVAGLQAFDRFRSAFDTVTRLADLLSVGQDELSAAVERQLQSLKTLQAEIQALRAERLEAEARRLVEIAGTAGGLRKVSAIYEDRPASELRLLGEALRRMEKTVAVLVSTGGQKYSVVIACAPDLSIQANQLLSLLLAPCGGRGGGDRTLAQGGGAASPGIAKTILEHFTAVVDSLL